MARAKASPRLRTPQKTPRRKKGKRWTEKEKAAVVQYVALHKDVQPTETLWPAMADGHVYWHDAVEFVAKTANTTPRKGMYIKTCPFYRIFHIGK